MPVTQTADEKRGEVLNELLTQTDLTNFDLRGEVFSDDEIGSIITKRVFNGNTDAQLASLMKGQVATLQLIVGINPAFKAIINASLSDLIAQLREISKVREATGLSSIDLSFLD